VFPSDSPGVNPAILNEMLLYYRLMTKWSGLGDSTELSRVGLSQQLQQGAMVVRHTLINSPVFITDPSSLSPSMIDSSVLILPSSMRPISNKSILVPTCKIKAKWEKIN
jgi:hypothetical protein